MRFRELFDTRLDEISRPATRKDVDAVLRKAGYKRLGYGAYGAVYQKSGSNYVLKIFDSNDRAYLDFIDFSKRHSNNPHFPKFFGKVVKVTHRYYAVKVELLSPYKGDSTHFREYIKNRDYAIKKPESLIAEIVNDALDELSNYPSLLQACDLLIDEFGKKHRFDIKDENIMMRGDTIVFVDPIADHEFSSGDFIVFDNDDSEKPEEKGKWSDDLDDLFHELKDAGF